MNKNLFYCTILFCLLAALSFSAATEQLHFSKTKKSDGYQFNYQWLDHQNIQQNISFTLSTEALFNRFRNFRAYKAELAEKAIFQALKKQWQLAPIENVQIQFPQSKIQFP